MPSPPSRRAHSQDARVAGNDASVHARPLVARGRTAVHDDLHEIRTAAGVEAPRGRPTGRPTTLARPATQASRGGAPRRSRCAAVRGAALSRRPAADHDGRARALRDARRLGDRRRRSRSGTVAAAWRASLDRPAPRPDGVGRRSLGRGRLRVGVARRPSDRARGAQVRAADARPASSRSSPSARSLRTRRRGARVLVALVVGAIVSAVTAVLDGARVRRARPPGGSFAPGTSTRSASERASGVFGYPTIGAMYWEAALPLLVVASVRVGERAAPRTALPRARVRVRGRAGERARSSWPSSRARRVRRSPAPRCVRRARRPRSARGGAAPQSRRRRSRRSLPSSVCSSVVARRARRPGSLLGQRLRFWHDDRGSASSTGRRTARVGWPWARRSSRCRSRCTTPGRSPGARGGEHADATSPTTGSATTGAATPRRRTRDADRARRRTSAPEASVEVAGDRRARPARARRVPPAVGPRAGETSPGSAIGATRCRAAVRRRGAGARRYAARRRTTLRRRSSPPAPPSRPRALASRGRALAQAGPSSASARTTSAAVHEALLPASPERRAVRGHAHPRQQPLLRDARGSRALGVVGARRASSVAAFGALADALLDGGRACRARPRRRRGTFFVHGVLDYFFEFTPPLGLFWVLLGTDVASSASSPLRRRSAPQTARREGDLREDGRRRRARARYPRDEERGRGRRRGRASAATEPGGDSLAVARHEKCVRPKFR